MSWASRRRLLYLIGVMLFLTIIFGGPIVYRIYKTVPTCHDGVQNGGETAKDMGGDCSLIDPHSMEPVSILWVRVLRVREGQYSVVAYLQNPNNGAFAYSAPYRLVLHDDAGVPIVDKSGKINIDPAGITPLYIGNIKTNKNVPKRPVLDIQSDLAKWYKASSATQELSIVPGIVQDATHNPNLSAKITNTSPSSRYDVSFVATLFDAYGNVVASSATIVPEIASGESKTIRWEWPEGFAYPISRVDILPIGLYSSRVPQIEKQHHSR